MTDQLDSSSQDKRKETKKLLEDGTYITDEKGRKIKVKKPGILSELRLAEALGAAANNEKYFEMVKPLIWICEIDNLPFHFGLSKREVEAAYERLGYEGINAFQTFIYTTLIGSDDDADAEKVKAEEISSIKK